MAQARRTVRVGIDVGSTTVKAVAVERRGGGWERVFSRYVRHGARQAATVAEVLGELSSALPNVRLCAALTGSGAPTLAEELELPYVQEVVANSIAVRELFPEARCAIELGGQDAKIVFFEKDPRTGDLTVSNMRMNGSCAGGTGAFLDEIASLLNVPSEEFNSLAASGTTVRDISGRCGVYAKTDIQPLLNQGVSKADLALSSLHAIAKQTIGGLAQGLDIEPPVVFEGGPLTFNPTLVRVFAERLGLSPEQVIVPEHAETTIALGTALTVDELFSERDCELDVARVTGELRELEARPRVESDGEPPFFSSEEERRRFDERHAVPAEPAPELAPGSELRCYLGIDSGSTTTKFALVGEDGRLVDSFYASNEGEPLDVALAALRELRDRYRERGVSLRVLGVGTTGYGELLFSRALQADYHVVETVAHARAARELVPDATFVLDIGGQDMKAIWLDHGVLTDIVVNEACSAGCGSFLEGFAATLGIPVAEIADAAFTSTEPANLGSRCTVFMNSSVVSEQRRGKGPADIMAGLCRSIIENVFTKVIRVSNLDNLGDRIVVQGGTFRNDAVLAAFEQYLGREVTRAPHPGLMGAIGVALLAHEQADRSEERRGRRGHSTFIGLDALERFTHTEYAGVTCRRCGNHCSRSVVAFSDGALFVTGNRCPRGEEIDWMELLREVPEAAADAPAGALIEQPATPGAPHRTGGIEPSEAVSATAGEQIKESVGPAIVRKRPVRAANLFDERERLLFQNWPCEPVAPERGETIGIPRVLEFWDNMPFWSTLFRALGFTVRISRPSTRRTFERGLPHVTSDTICFPAKLVHGHVRDLVDAQVDRIFMPIITTVPTENTAKTSEWMCAVVKGYPYVLKNSDNPEERYGVPFDAPLFHWYTMRDRTRQLSRFLKEAYGVSDAQAARAIEQADAAQHAFAAQLEQRGQEVLDEVRRTGSYAVVVASRPYHNDPLVNHGVPKLFSNQGIAVLTPDAVPGVRSVDLSKSRLDIVNNFHARMLASAVIVASSPELEYVQLVSFGCGHDAYLSDEIVRLMREISGKAPLILKIDESDATGPLRIRVRSFIETTERRRREEAGRSAAVSEPHKLPDPYEVKYTERDRREKVFLIPNTSHAFSQLMAAALRHQGVRADPMPVGRDEAIRLGKRYVHNDICFPAQIVIGEALEALESGRYDDKDVAILTGKYIGDCRLTHYMPLLRRALDDAGYAHVPVATNDNEDAHDAYPGFRLSLGSSMAIAWGLPMIDALEALLRRMRPYELEPGSADAAFTQAVDAVMKGIEAHGVRGAETGFARAIEIMRGVRYDRSHPRPQVLIVGEYLLNFHPGANHEIERYLERNGLEVIEARMTDVIRKSYFYKHAQSREYHVDLPLQERVWNATADSLFDIAHTRCDRIAQAHPLYEPPVRMPELVKVSDDVLHHTFDAGEGVLIPAEILEHAAHGCRAFVILQPFGCLPNHVVGRGLVRALKKRYPDAQILPLDYDPDVSFANVENRLQMLIMNTRNAAAGNAAKEGAGHGETA